MDNIRLVQLCTQAIAMRYCTRDELRAQVGSEKVSSLRGKQRNDFIAYLTSKFGRLYSVFDTRGVLYIVGGQAISTAAMYVLSEFKRMPYLWSAAMPLSLGGNLGTSEIKRQAREAKNFLVVIGGAVHMVPHDPQAPSVPSDTDEDDGDDQPARGLPKRPVAKAPALAASYGECAAEMPPAVPQKSPAPEKGEAILGVTYGPVKVAQAQLGMLYSVVARVEEFTPGERWLFNNGHVCDKGPAAPRTHALQCLWGEK